LVAVLVIAAAVALRVMGIADSFIDNIALIALGAVFGAASSTVVNGNAINAAHNRLDQVGAPPAKDREG
jgi:hypothetical protein